MSDTGCDLSDDAPSPAANGIQWCSASVVSLLNPLTYPVTQALECAPCGPVVPQADIRASSLPLSGWLPQYWSFSECLDVCGFRYMWLPKGTELSRKFPWFPQSEHSPPLRRHAEVEKRHLEGRGQEGPGLAARLRCLWTSRGPWSSVFRNVRGTCQGIIFFKKWLLP